MKKKSKFLLCLIVTIVLSLALPCLGSSVSAANTSSVAEGTQTLKGQALLDFLLTNYAVVVGVSDTYNDWSANTQWLDADLYQYQFTYDDVGDNVYLTFTFPNKNGVVSPIKGKYAIIKFMSFYTSQNGVPEFAFNEFKTTIYKRYNVNTGDVNDGVGDPYLSLVLGSSDPSNANGINYSVSTDTLDLVDYSFPLLNQTTKVVNGVTISPWIVPEQPYQLNSSGNFKIQTVKAVELEVDYNSMRDSGVLDEGLTDISILYNTGQPYINGAIMMAIEPITITVQRTFEDQLLRPSLSDKDYSDNMQAGADSTHSSMNNFTDQIGGDVSSINTNTDRPSFDIWSLVSFNGIGVQGLAGGLNTLVDSTSHLFSSVYILYFVAPAIPPIIISYLLFGKKG